MSRSPTSRRSSRVVVRGALALCVAVALVSLGGARPEARVAMHAVVGLALVALVAAGSRASSAGWIRVVAPLLLAGSAALLPLPRAALDVVAPGTIEAFPAASWRPAGLDAGATADSLALAGLLVAFGALAAAAARSRGSTAALSLAVSVTVPVVAAVGVVHHLVGARALFGWIAPRTVPERFFPPFVDPDHLGTFLAVGLPFLVRGAAGSGGAGAAREGARPAYVGGALVVVATLVAIRSQGALAAAGAGVIVLALLDGASADRRRPAGALALGAAAATVAAVVAASVAERGELADAVGSRGIVWAAALRALPRFWLLGSGLGTFDAATLPYRADGTWQSFAHAHADPLEWLVETGLAGFVAAALAVRAAAPALRRAAATPDLVPVVAALAAVAVHSLVDFPLHIPALALVATGLLAFAVGRVDAVRRADAASEGATERTSSRGTSAGTVALAGVQGAGLAWSARAAVVAALVARGASADADLDRAAAGLDLARADVPERWLFRARARLADGDLAAAKALAADVVARFPADPSALRNAAILLDRAGDRDGAAAALARARARDPIDWRIDVLLARVAAETDPLSSAPHWRDAFVRHAPYTLVPEAYRSVPVGAFWLDALDGVPAQVVYALAVSCLEHGEPDEALEALDRAAAADPAFGRVPLRGQALAAAGRADEAMTYLEGVLARDPGNVEALLDVGRIEESRGQYAEAAATYARGADASVALRVAQLRAVERSEGPDAALGIVRRCELTGPVDDRVGLEVAAIRRRQGDLRGCEDEIRERNLVHHPAIEADAAALLSSCESTR